MKHLSHKRKYYVVIIEIVGFPRLLLVGKEDGFNYIIMDMLGPNLEDLFNLCG